MFFAKNSTMESRLAAALADLETTKASLTTALAGTEASTARIAELESQLTAETATREGEAARAGVAEASLVSAHESLAGLRTAVSSALALTEEQLTAFAAGDHAVFTGALEIVATRKAVQIAAGQGVPPVLTEASSAGASTEEETKLAFSTAAAEPDPRKRAALFAKARAQVEKAPHGNN